MWKKWFVWKPYSYFTEGKKQSAILYHLLNVFLIIGLKHKRRSKVNMKRYDCFGRLTQVCNSSIKRFLPRQVNILNKLNILYYNLYIFICHQVARRIMLPNPCKYVFYVIILPGLSVKIMLSQNNRRHPDSS